MDRLAIWGPPLPGVVSVISGSTWSTPECGRAPGAHRGGHRLAGVEELRACPTGRGWLYARRVQDARAVADPDGGDLQRQPGPRAVGAVHRWSDGSGKQQVGERRRHSRGSACRAARPLAAGGGARGASRRRGRHTDTAPRAVPHPGTPRAGTGPSPPRGCPPGPLGTAERPAGCGRGACTRTARAPPGDRDAA